MQSVGGTSLLSRSVTATVVSKTYRRTRDNRALSTQAAVPYLRDRVDICHLLDCRWSDGIRAVRDLLFWSKPERVRDESLPQRCRRDRLATRVLCSREFGHAGVESSDSCGK